MPQTSDHRVLIRDADRLLNSVTSIFEELQCGSLRGQKVFVKPNMLRIAQRAECAITDPELLAAVVSALVSMKARITVGDNPIYQRVDGLKVAEKCGFLAASQGYLKNIGTEPLRVKLQNRLVGEISISRGIQESDFLISLPKFKTHILTMMSGAIKNHYGIIPGAMKTRLHSVCSSITDFCGLLVDVYEVRPPDLIISDCMNIHDAQGKEYAPRKIIASKNGYALDHVCAQIAGIEPRACPVLRIAQDRGLYDPGRIRVSGDLGRLENFSPPFDFPLKNILAGFGARLWARAQRRLCPVIDREDCARCGECAEACPEQAIQHQSIDHRRCGQCYCCMEVCARGAIRRKFKLT